MVRGAGFERRISVCRAQYDWGSCVQEMVPILSAPQPPKKASAVPAATMSRDFQRGSKPLATSPGNRAPAAQVCASNKSALLLLLRGGSLPDIEVNP